MSTQAKQRANWAGGGMFTMGLIFTIVGASMPNQSLLIIGVVFLISAGCGFIAGGFSYGPWTPPEVAGPATTLKSITPDDAPKSDSAVWHGDELEVQASKAATIELFNVRLPDVDACKLGYRFLIQTEELKSQVYPEMWCHLGRWRKFFSRGVNDKISGTHAWTEVEIPFYLQRKQVAHLLNLNIVFEGPGKARLKQIEVTSAPIA